MKCCKIVTKYTYLQTKDKIIESVAERRELLKTPAKKPEYAALI